MGLAEAHFFVRVHRAGHVPQFVPEIPSALENLLPPGALWDIARCVVVIHGSLSKIRRHHCCSGLRSPRRLESDSGAVRRSAFSRLNSDLAAQQPILLLPVDLPTARRIHSRRTSLAVGLCRCGTRVWQTISMFVGGLHHCWLQFE